MSLSFDQWLLITSAVVVTAINVAAVATFVCCCFRASTSDRLRRRIKEGAHLTKRSGAQVLKQSPDPPKDDHRAFLKEEVKLADTSLVVGAIGLAAWGQLFVASNDPPTNQLSGLTLGLLFTGSAVLLTSPLLWRFSGLYITDLGRDAALEVGYSFIGFALASIVVDLRIWALGQISAAVSLAVAALATINFWTTVKLLKALNLEALIPPSDDGGGNTGSAQGSPES